MKRLFPARFASLLTAVTAATASALGGCGSLDTNTSTAPAIASLTGQLVNPDSLAITGSTRVAVVWEAGDGTFSTNVAEDLPVQPVFPSSFTISLDGAPPASSLVDGFERFGGGGEGSAVDPGAPGSATETPQDVSAQGAASSSASPYLVAVGSVVAYVDLNGNGKLDLVADGASGYVDQIAATNESLMIVWAQGAVPSEGPQVGYNEYQLCEATPPPPTPSGSICPMPPDAGTTSAPVETCGAPWQAIDVPITLSLSTDPRVNDLMCQSLTNGVNAANSNGPTTLLTGRPTTYPSPCDTGLDCANDGSSYFYASCQTISQGICEGTTYSCRDEAYERPSPVPADWPCKAE